MLLERLRDCVGQHFLLPLFQGELFIPSQDYLHLIYPEEILKSMSNLSSNTPTSKEPNSVQD